MSAILAVGPYTEAERDAFIAELQPTFISTRAELDALEAQVRSHARRHYLLTPDDSEISKSAAVDAVAPLTPTVVQLLVGKEAEATPLERLVVMCLLLMAKSLILMLLLLPCWCCCSLLLLLLLHGPIGSRRLDKISRL
jgi:hypothetical protein